MEWQGSDLPCDLIYLSKKGFEVIKHSLGELREVRFLPQSVVHDYWATAIHLGNFVHGIPPEVRFFTEQELQCTDDSLLPDWVPKSRSHIPDGMTRIKSGDDSRVVAIEVELNLKPYLRYDKAAYYFDAGLSKFDLVIWVCASRWILEQIVARLAGLRLRNLNIHQFVLTSDFQTHGFKASVTHGTRQGQTLEEIYLVNGWVSPGSSLDKAGATKSSELFFPTLKSPRSLMRYRKPVPSPNF